MSDIVERLRTAASNNRIQAERGTTTTGEILTALGCQTKEAVAGMHDEAAAEIDRLRSLLKEAGEALAPFSHYSEMRAAKPLLGLGDSVHVIHPGSEWEANIKLSDCYNARTVLSKIKR